MEISTPTTNVQNKYKYPETHEKSGVYEISTTKRRRLFENYNDEKSDDETAHVDKKVSIAKEPIIYTNSILQAYAAKEYVKCLSLIDEVSLLPVYHPQYMEAKCTQFKIIQAACWTMTDMKVAETFAILKEVIEKEPKNSFAFYAYGLAQYRNGDFKECVKSFTKAIEINPSGAMMRAMELKSKARSLLEMLNDANVQYKMNNCYKAVEILNTAVLIDPDNKTALKTIFGIRDQIMNDLIRRLEADIETELPNKYTDVENMIKSNRYDEAEKLVNELYNEEPKTAQAAYIKGLSVYMSGGLKKALSYFNEALELEPEHKNVIELIAKTKKLINLVEKASEQMSTADYPGAIKTLTEALNVDKCNRVINQASHLQRALANFNQGNSKEAFEDYRQFEILKKIVKIDVSNFENSEKEEAKMEASLTPESPDDDEHKYNEEKEKEL